MFYNFPMQPNQNFISSTDFNQAKPQTQLATLFFSSLILVISVVLSVLAWQTFSNPQNPLFAKIIGRKSSNVRIDFRPVQPEVDLSESDQPVNSSRPLGLDQ
jgi:hypothetical protein